MYTCDSFNSFILTPSLPSHSFRKYQNFFPIGESEDWLRKATTLKPDSVRLCNSHWRANIFLIIINKRDGLYTYIRYSQPVNNRHPWDPKKVAHCSEGGCCSEVGPKLKQVWRSTILSLTIHFDLVRLIFDLVRLRFG